MSLVGTLLVALILNVSAHPLMTVSPVGKPSFVPRKGETIGAFNATARRWFIRLCNLAVERLSISVGKEPFFIESYEVRALCVAYDMTGDRQYLDACKIWSERMVKFQKEMIPAGAYYTNYGRTPGENHGDWYVADCSSIAMGVLSTAVRCNGPGRKSFLASVEHFWRMVSHKFVRPSGGVTDGFWPQSDRSWWCSSSLFGSLTFMLYADTGNGKYLQTGLRIVDWLNKLDLRKAGPLPLSEQGPSMPMYVMEAYSSSWRYLSHSAARKAAALKQVSWCLNWIARQQRIPFSKRKWDINGWWGAKYAGLPFHQYMFSHYIPSYHFSAEEARRAMRRLSDVVFAKGPVLTQLASFMMISYAEQLDPGAIYRSIGRRP